MDSGGVTSNESKEADEFPQKVMESDPDLMGRGDLFCWGGIFIMLGKTGLVFKSGTVAPFWFFKMVLEWLNQS